MTDKTYNPVGTTETKRIRTGLMTVPVGWYFESDLTAEDTTHTHTSRKKKMKTLPKRERKRFKINRTYVLDWKFFSHYNVQGTYAV